MRQLHSDAILPFLNAHHRFIQILVNGFALSKAKTGLKLSVHFGDDDLALWSDLGKHEARKMIPDFETKVLKYRKALDSFLCGVKIGRFKPKNMAGRFPFRYASGGTLPIIRRGHDEYYCLFYRDILPVGWNIANGGCDSLHELLHPGDTIERELREELVVFSQRRRQWLLFEAGDGDIAARPDFLNIRSIMHRQYPHLGLAEFGIAEIPLTWLDGPDKLHVSYRGERPSKTSGCFLNINPEDFGIEIDRVAWITIDDDAILYDGESCGDTLINSPVGLFQVERFNELVKSGCNHFLPDLFFYDAKCFNDGPRHIEQKVSHYVNKMSRMRPRVCAQEYRKSPLKFDMCPVTREIVRRYRSTLTRKPKDQYDVFISFGSEDESLARRIYEYLRKDTRKRVFFSTETMHDGDYMRQLAHALDLNQAKLSR